ncbi:MAG: hypothetical protein IPG02_19905 [Ignavibacteria bacterium]|nr:hypothetical protein [Ignavibacteria bacterium]
MTHFTIRALLFVTIFAYIASCGKEEQKTQTDTQTPKQETTSTKELGDNVSTTYNITGAINGTMTIKRNGKELKQIIDSEMMGMKSLNVIYIKGNTAYSITEVAGKKMSMKTSMNEYNNRKLTGETIADPKDFERLLEGKSVKGSENILGYNCDIYDLGNNVFLSVANKKHILRIKSPEFLAVATDIQALPENSASEFELPQGVDFKMVSPQEAPRRTKLDSALKELKK